MSEQSFVPIIDGESWQDAGLAEFVVTNPATGESLGKETECDPAAVGRIVESSKRAFQQQSWQKTSAAERGRMLLKLADLVEQHAEELVQTELQDTGKPITQLRAGELPLTADIIRFYAGAADKIEGSIKSGTPAEVLMQIVDVVKVQVRKQIVHHPQQRLHGRCRVRRR